MPGGRFGLAIVAIAQVRENRLQSNMPELSKEQITANIELWCQALDSGEYIQGVGQLHYQDTNTGVQHFCCLGVGAKELGLPCNLVNDPSVVVADRKEFCYGEEGENALAPAEFMKMVGLKTAEGSYYVDGELEALTSRNDSDGWNFKQIADLIRSRPQGLFIEGV